MNDQPPNSSPGHATTIDKSLLDACIHCGLCLPACPTYLATGREMESPRGRIYLLNEMTSGRLALDDRLAEHIDSCLGCYGCQTACPSGVQYQSILEQARPLMNETKPPILLGFMRFGFRRLLPNYPLLRILGKLLRVWQFLPGEKLLRLLAGVDERAVISMAPAEQINPARNVFYGLWRRNGLLPQVPPFKPLARKSWHAGEKKGTVQLFPGCLMDVFYNDVNHDCADLLKAQGCIVEVPEQTCCGALAFHAGEGEIATNLAKLNIASFEGTTGDIVVTAAGCGAMLKEYGHMLAKDDSWAQRAAAFSARVLDITEALVRNKFPKPVNAQTAFPKTTSRKIAYHAACHLAHAQNIREAPQKLLADLAVDCTAAHPQSPIELVALKEAEHCCGSAGIYNLLNTDLSMEVLARKMDFIAQTGADTVVTTNPGCMLQLKAGARDRSMPIKVLHICELLHEAYVRNPDESD